jgi:peptidoglycan/LPS O-acetylase OafA/YrhL
MHANRTYLTTLTPLRGIAALLVVVFHSNLMLRTFIEPFGANFIASGWLWVDFFFVLSGFILGYVYGNDFRDSVKSNSYWTYMKSRFARVYPLHFVTLIWCLLCALIIRHYAKGMAPFFDQTMSPLSAIPSLFLVQAMGIYQAAPLNTPSWSLSTEWWMYMIFPLITPILFRLKTMGKLALLIGIALLAVFIKYYLSPISFPGPPTLNVVADFGFLRCMAGFLLGMLTFKIYDESIAANFFQKDAVFLIIFSIIIYEMAIGGIDLFIFSLFPFLILAAAHNSSRVKKVLDTKPLQRLGDWSFSIYMVHVPIMYIFWIFDVRKNPEIYAVFPPPMETLDPMEGIKYCLILLPLTLLVAAITYKYVEVPSRKYLNARFRKKQIKGNKDRVEETLLSSKIRS